MRVLIGYDGSKCANSALDDLTHAGLPGKGEALLMSVAEVYLPPVSAYEIMDMAAAPKGAVGIERKYTAGFQAVKDADDLAAKAAARFQIHFPNWKVSHESIWGSPNWELFAKAEEWKADLIVVGSHGRTALGRLFLGSISQWLLNEARCSVRVARGRLDEPDFPVRLLLGLDGSRNANKALEQIAVRNWPEKSEVRVVMVDQPVELDYVSGVAPQLKHLVKVYNQKESQRGRRLVNAAADQLKHAGLRTMTDVIAGDPKKVLVQVAEEWRADCIFVGATGLTDGLERFLLGSTAAAVAARAHCSVEIVRTRRRKRKTNGNGN